jgi:hypothetical protein
MVPKRTSDMEAMRDASGVCTMKGCPQASVAGADVMAGRGPLNKYGGEKNSALN